MVMAGGMAGKLGVEDSSAMPTPERTETPYRSATMTKLLACATVAMTVLAGCMLGPDYQRPTLSLPAQYRDAEPPALGQEAMSLANLQIFGKQRRCW